MTWLNASFSAPSRRASRAPDISLVTIAPDLRPARHYLLDRIAVPAPDAAFSPSHKAPALSAEEKKYLCFSVRDGVEKYIDLRAASYMRDPPAGLDFPARFRTIYTEAQQARFFAAGNLDKAFTAEDDPVTEPSAHPGWWWNEWPGSTEMRRTSLDLTAFDQRVRHADDFFRHLRQAHGVLHRAIGPRTSGVGPDALADILRYGPRQHRNARVSPDWKFGPQMMADADRFNRITIKELRFESATTRTRVPYARYQDITLRGGHYRIGDGPWRANPYPENDDLEKAKYLALTALIRQARGRHTQIRNRDDPQDPRDYTGSGWLQRWMKAFGFSSSRGEEHGAG